MKKLSVMLILTISLSLIFSINAFADNISVYVDNEHVQLTDATGANVYPFIQNGTTYVPLRGISETLDCDVIWDGNNNTILIYKDMVSDNSVFRNKSDEIKLYVDNQLVELKDANGTIVKPFIKDGTTYVPLRGVSQVLGCWVRWNGQTKTVSIYMNICPPDGVTLTENKPYDLSYCWGYYENEGQYLEFDNSAYTNALKMKRSGDAFALFNLDGKYSSMTMTVGSYDAFELEKEILFIVDGKIVETYKLLPNSSSQKIQISLNNGLQLKIKINGWYVGIGDIIFWGE